MSRLRSLLANLLFLGLLLLYFRDVQPFLLTRLVHVYAARQPDLLLAVILVGVQVLELAGLWFKWPILVDEMRYSGNGSRLARLFAGFWVLGWRGLIDLFILSMLLMAAGANDLVLSLPCLFGGLLITFSFFRLAVCWTAIYSLLCVPPVRSGQPVPLPSKLTDITRRSCLAAEFSAPAAGLPVSAKLTDALLGDTLLIIVSAMSFTIAWDLMVAISPPTENPSGWTYLWLGFIYLACFFSSRAFFTLEEWLTRQAVFQRLASLAVLVVAMIVALASVP